MCEEVRILGKCHTLHNQLKRSMHRLWSTEPKGGPHQGPVVRAFHPAVLSILTQEMLGQTKGDGGIKRPEHILRTFSRNFNVPYIFTIIKWFCPSL